MSVFGVRRSFRTCLASGITRHPPPRVPRTPGTDPSVESQNCVRSIQRCLVHGVCAGLPLHPVPDQLKVSVWSVVQRDTHRQTESASDECVHTHQGTDTYTQRGNGIPPALACRRRRSSRWTSEHARRLARWSTRRRRSTHPATGFSPWPRGVRRPYMSHRVETLFFMGRD